MEDKFCVGKSNVLWQSFCYWRTWPWAVFIWLWFPAELV